jgi:cytochrome c553
MQPRDPRAQHATPGSSARRRCGKRIAARAISLVTALAFSFASAAHSAQNEKTAVPARELQAKMAYCENCHGVSGRGFQGYYPIPRLAGQQPEYIKNQLQAFI